MGTMMMGSIIKFVLDAIELVQDVLMVNRVVRVKLRGKEFWILRRIFRMLWILFVAVSIRTIHKLILLRFVWLAIIAVGSVLMEQVRVVYFVQVMRRGLWMLQLRDVYVLMVSLMMELLKLVQDAMPYAKSAQTRPPQPAPNAFQLCSSNWTWLLASRHAHPKHSAKDRLWPACHARMDVCHVRTPPSVWSAMQQRNCTKATVWLRVLLSLLTKTQQPDYAWNVRWVVWLAQATSDVWLVPQVSYLYHK